MSHVHNTKKLDDQSQINGQTIVIVFYGRTYCPPAINGNKTKSHNIQHPVHHSHRLVILKLSIAKCQQRAFKRG